MTRTESIDAFFILLRAGLWEQSCLLAACEPIDFKEVYRVAEEQSVRGLIAAGLEHVQDVQVPDGDAKEFARAVLKLEKINEAMNQFVAKLLTRMGEMGIKAFLLKGQGIAQCYERPLWRTCGDIDLLLDEEDYEKAKAFIIPYSSSVEVEGRYNKHFGSMVGPWKVELHGNLRGGLSPRIDKLLDAILQDTFSENIYSSIEIKGTQVNLLGDENNIIYVFTHFLEHFYKGGIGMRQICDWCRMIWTKKDELRINVLENALLGMGIMDEWKAFAAFSVSYLGMPKEAMPFYDNSKKWTKKASKICDFILKVGNFGKNRDVDHFKTKPVLVRKSISFGIRVGDLFRHARLFPWETIRFMPTILFNGFVSAIHGE